MYGSDGKESAHNVGDPGSICGLGESPGGGHGNPLQYSCLENPMDKGGWWGPFPWGRKELDMTERLTLAEKRDKAPEKGFWVFLEISLPRPRAGAGTQGLFHHPCLPHCARNAREGSDGG